MLILASTTLIFAQVKEVKGVATRMVCYAACQGYDSGRIYGFEFKNLNRFAVTIEAECWRSIKGQSESSRGEQPKPYLLKTKTFILSAGETFIWEADLTTAMDNIYKENHSAGDGYYYTVFKAFKNED